jgi:hypothetical protein
MECHVRKLENERDLRQITFDELKAQHSEMKLLEKKESILSWQITDPDAIKRSQLQQISFISTYGMFGYWLLQWLWWAGFVGVAGDL